jgi:hypothetical protein
LVTAAAALREHRPVTAVTAAPVSIAVARRARARFLREPGGVVHAPAPLRRRAPRRLRAVAVRVAFEKAQTLRDRFFTLQVRGLWKPGAFQALWGNWIQRVQRPPTAPRRASASMVSFAKASCAVA